MPVVNIGLQRMRDRIIASVATVVDSIGIGTGSTAEAAGDTALGVGAANSYWKSGGALTSTTGGDGTVDPWFQFEATWATSEANDASAIREIGTSAGTLSGTNPAGEDGTKLFTRKLIGGITKTTDIELVARVRVTF